MVIRIDKLAVEIPMAPEQDVVAARNVQELLGGRFGEMSTLMNYTYQSFNFRGRDSIKPYYELIANIAAEEYGHIELVAASINSLLTGPRTEEELADPLGTPFKMQFDGLGNPHHFIVGGMSALCQDSRNAPWTGDNVFSSGNLILDLLHNFFLENGARTQKLRVYESTNNPAARAMLGYLFVRGGVHAAAYGKALEKLTGVEMNKMLPIPNLPTTLFPEAKKWMDQGSHQTLYRFSPKDYNNLAEIWNGVSPEDGSPVSVADLPDDYGSVKPDLAPISESFAPEYNMDTLRDVAAKLDKKANGF